MAVLCVFVFFLFPFPNFEIFEQFSRNAILYILHIFNNNMAETRNSEAAAKQRRVIQCLERSKITFFSKNMKLYQESLFLCRRSVRRCRKLRYFLFLQNKTRNLLWKYWFTIYNFDCFNAINFYIIVFVISLWKKLSFSDLIFLGLSSSYDICEFEISITYQQIQKAPRIRWYNLQELLHEGYFCKL